MIVTKNRIFVSALFSIAAFASLARADFDPVYAKLKPYRTYYSIKNVAPFAQQFRVWFTHIEANACSVAVNTKEEVGALTEKTLPCGWGAFGFPPKEIPPVPEGLKDLASAIEKRVREIYPDLSDFKIGYYGNFRVLSVTSTTLISTNQAPGKTLVSRSDYRLSHTKGADRLELAPGAAGFGGVSLLCFKDLPGYDCPESPKFVDYRLPTALEGSDLYYGATIEKQKSYLDAIPAFSAAVIATADAILDGSYRNPIEGLLKAQGEFVLPEDLNPFVEFNLNAYARAKDFKDQRSDGSYFRFRLRDTAKSPVMIERKSEATGLTYRVTLDTRDAEKLSLAINVTSPGGESGSSSLRLKGESLSSDGLTVPNGSWSLEREDEDRPRYDLQFGPYGTFTGFDISYGDIRKSSVNEPSPKQ